MRPPWPSTVSLCLKELEGAYKTDGQELNKNKNIIENALKIAGQHIELQMQIEKRARWGFAARQIAYKKQKAGAYDTAQRNSTEAKQSETNQEIDPNVNRAHIDSRKQKETNGKQMNICKGIPKMGASQFDEITVEQSNSKTLFRCNFRFNCPRRIF
jgi:hypothetical protein